MTFDNVDAWADASAGSADAQMTLCEEVIVAGADSRMPWIEALVAAETLARLAVIWGNPAHTTKLAGILFWRSQYAEDAGEDEQARAYMIEATSLLAVADEMGCTHAGDMLASYAGLLGPETMAAVAANYPFIMAAAKPAGHA